MKNKQSFGVEVIYKGSSKEVQNDFKGKKNLPIRRNNTSILEQLERLLPNQDKTNPIKRFPKEVFIPAINKNKRVAPNETVNIKPYSFDFRQSKQSTATTNLPRVQLTKTITSNELIPPLIGPLLIPTILNSARPKSNQCMNLEMTFKSKSSSTISPKIDLIKGTKSSPLTIRTSENSVRLKPIQRTVYSSQGGTIKILLPRNFVAAETRPNTNEEDLVKINPSSIKKINKVFGSSSFLDKIIEASKCNSGRNETKKVRDKEKEEERMKMCDVTFGRNDFKQRLEI